MKKISLLFCAVISISFSALAQTTIYSNDFSGGSSGWSLDESQVFDLWTVNNVYSCSVNTPDNGGGNYLHISDDLDGDECDVAVYTESAGGDCFATMTSDVSTVGYTGVSISFSWLCAGQNGGFGVFDTYGTVWYSIDGGSNWTQIVKPVSNFWLQSSWTTTTISTNNYPALANEAKLRLRFGWVNSGTGNDPAFGIDNLVITGTGGGNCTNAGGTATATTQSICNGLTDTINLTGSTGTIQWQQSGNGTTNWANVTGGSGATTTSYTTPALSLTTYYRAVLSESSCPDQLSTVTSVTVKPLPPIAINPPSASVCVGASIDFTGSGASTYSWAPATSLNKSTGATVTAIPGTTTTYTLTGVGANGCSNTETVVVIVNPLPKVSATGIDATCGNSNGKINLSVTNGTPAYTFNWSNGSTTQNQTGLPGNVLLSVTVTDMNGCSAITSSQIDDMPAAKLTATPTDATCGLFNGSVNLTVTGTGPFTYNWSNGATTQNISNLAAASYAVTVTDANGCSSTASTTVNNTNGPSATALPTDATCGNSNGSVALTVSGGTLPYTYQWNNGATTQNISNLTAVIYAVTVQDANGCSVSVSTTVNSSNGPVASTVPTNATCGLLNGSVSLTVSGGASTYTYSWSNTATTQNIGNLAAGTFTVTVTDANKCTATASATVNNIAGPTITLAPTDATCGQNNGAITTTISGGTAPYSFSWKPSETSQNLTNLAAGTYSLTITDVNGCTAGASTMVNTTGGVVASVNILTNGGPYCAGATADFSASITNGGSKPTYQWIFDGVPVVGATNSSYQTSPLQAGNHSVYVILTSNAVCVTNSPDTSNTAPIIVSANVTPSVSITTNPGTTICPGTNVTFTANPVNGGTPNFQWKVNGGTVVSNNSDFSSNSLQNGDVVSVTMNSTLNCVTTSSATTNVSITITNTPPVTPTSNAATNIASTQATTNWSAATGATNYFLDVSTSNTFSTFVTGYNNLSVGNVTSVTVTGLTGLTQYFYRVRSNSNCGTSSSSNTISFTTTGCAPLVAGTVAPATSVVCPDSAKTLTLTGASGGTLQWQISSDNKTWKNVTTGGTASTYTTLKADGITKKYYRCLSTNSCYTLSSATATVDISITPVVTITNVTSSTVTISFTPFASGCSSISWLGGAGSGNTTGVTSNTFTISALTPNQDLIITVTSVCAQCPGVTAASVSTRTLCAVPVITNFAALPSPKHGFKINWNAVSGSSSYRVYYRDISSSGSWSFVDTTGTAKTILVPFGGHTYAMYVAAKDCPSSGKIGDGSTTAYVTTNPQSGCTPVPNVTAVSNCPNQLSITINGGSGPYLLTLRKVSPAVSAPAAYKITGNTLNLTLGTQYAGSVWEVFAQTNCGATLSDPSQVAIAIIKPACSVVNNPVLDQVTCHGFVASWNTSDCFGLAITNYELLIKKNGTLNYTAYSAGITDHMNVAFLTPGTSYNVAVIAVACNGASSTTSNADTITLPSACRQELTGQGDSLIETGNGTEAVAIYPNPSAGQFYMDISRIDLSTATVKIELLNQLGQVVQTDISDITNGHLSHIMNAPTGLAGGMYFVRTSVGGNVYVSRVVISRE